MADRLRLRFPAGEIGDREFQLLYDWHLALRGGEYGRVETLEPWRVIEGQAYIFTDDAVEFEWLDFATKSGLAEAARDLGGIVVEEFLEGDWKEVRCWSERREGIFRVIAEQQALLRED